MLDAKKCDWDCIKNLRNDFDFFLEFRDILFFYTESRQKFMQFKQKREYYEIQDQNQNRP